MMQDALEGRDGGRVGKPRVHATCRVHDIGLDCVGDGRDEGGGRRVVVEQSVLA
jgi:hypothetical protein